MAVERKTWHRRHVDSLNAGQRAADYLRNIMGSWSFVAGFLAFMVVWMGINSWGLLTRAWDPYPYILLNLFLSMMAGLQGAILLIAAKRQDEISAALADHDYETDCRAEAEIQQLMAINAQQLELLERLVRALESDAHRPDP